MKDVFNSRFSILAEAEQRLKACIRIGDIIRDQTLRWALLQHYEVCPTPLLDVTSSLQIALSFAIEETTDNTLLFVFAVPQITGVVSVSIESGTQVVRLSQICPPEALRPHFQVASLIGNYPALDTEDFLMRPHRKLRFNLAGRVLAKFRLNNCKSWGETGFKATPAYILRPDKEDHYFEMMADVVASIHPQLQELQRSIEANRLEPQRKTGETAEVA